MNGQKPLLRALAGESLAHPPFWLMRQAGRYLPEYRALRQKAGSFLGLCYTPDFAAEATLQPIRRFGMDGAILFSDILVIADALDRAVDFVEGDGPRVAPIATADDLAGEPAPGKLAPVYDALRRIKTELPNDTALIGFAGGPWTVATYLIEGGRSDFSRAKHWAFAETERLDRVIDRLVDATIQHLAAQIDAGAEIVQLFDSWAGMLPEAQFHRFVIQPTRRIVDGVKARHPKTPIIGFPRGAGLMYRTYFVETRVDALSLDWGVPLEIARRTLQSIGPVQGNLDPQLLVAGGAALDAAVRAILEALGTGPFVFNLGHGILPGTPIEHVERLKGLLRGGQ
ncbi:MAG TPA: uroporphyrinogen decarboxylase [Stellaceae bacterium]|nr:uroporphyrinogen decarboxylase [Stellaceae bacterium]